MSQQPSLVAELMSRVIPTETQEIEKLATKVKECYEESSYQLTDLIERCYARKDISCVINMELKKLSSDLNETRDQSQQRIHRESHLSLFAAKERDVETELEQINSLITTVDQLITFQREYGDAKVAIHGNFYVEAVNHILTARATLECVVEKIPTNLAVHIKTDFELNLEFVREMVRTVWFECIHITFPEEVVSYGDAIKVSVSLSQQFESYTLKEICEMLSQLNLFEDMFKQFSHLFLKYVIKPIFSIKTVSVLVNDSGLEDKINFSHKNGFNNTEEIPLFLTRVLQIVSQTFTPFGRGKEQLIEFGLLIWAPIIKVLHSLLLEREFEMTETLKSDWLAFEESLISFGILKIEQKAINSLLLKLDTGFKEKRQASILGETRELIKSDLSLTTNVSIKVNNNRLTDYLTENRTESDLQSSLYLTNHPLTKSEMNYLKENLFIFPSCSVSIFAIEFMQKCDQLMTEATQHQTQTAFDILKTIRLMLQMFISLTPFHHNVQITSVPRSVAIFYNSCLYISHCLITLGFEFRERMPAPLNSEVCTFIDFVPVIRNVGEQTWYDMILKQKVELKEIISPLQNSIQGMSDAKGDLVQKSFILLNSHLGELSKVWREVLPLYLVHGSIGLILNVALECCINSVLSLTDISAKDASRAANIFSLLRDRCVALFHTDSERESELIGEECENWFRFTELIILLEAGLSEIRERWGEGRGPFGANFKSSEVRNFVKGSFKNSERRSELLASIV